VGDYLLSPADFRRNFRAAPDFSVIAKRAPGGSAKEARAQIESVLEDYPTVQVEDQAGFREHQRSQVIQLLGLIYALLALTIVVASSGSPTPWACRYSSGSVRLACCGPSALSEDRHAP
jgi:hypothetical protein